MLVDHLLKTKKVYKNLKKRMQDVFNLNGLDKYCLQHDRAYGDCKDLPRRTVSDKVLRDKDFNIAKTTKNDECYKKHIANIAMKNLLLLTQEQEFTLIKVLGTNN